MMITKQKEVLDDRRRLLMKHVKKTGFFLAVLAAELLVSFGLPALLTAENRAQGEIIRGGGKRTLPVRTGGDGIVRHSPAVAAGRILSDYHRL